MSKELDYIKGIIAKLEDDYQHYTMCEKDEVKAHLIKCDIEEYQAVEQALEQKEKLEKVVEIGKKKIPHIAILCSSENVDVYNLFVKAYGGKTLTEEEFNILNDVFMVLTYNYFDEKGSSLKLTNKETELLKEVLK